MVRFEGKHLATLGIPTCESIGGSNTAPNYGCHPATRQITCYPQASPQYLWKSLSLR